MFINWNDPCVRLTGRWSRLEEDSTNPYTYMRPTAQYTTTTAPGEFIQRYAELVDMIRENTPEAIIVCLTPFVGAYNDEIGDFVESYNRSHEKGIHYVSTKGWIEPEPLHPLRSGHLTVADNFTPILKDILKSSI